MSSRTIPLFPLHTVLFPRTPLSLRIFEERFRSMIDRCMAQERPFGVVLIREGHEAGPPATPCNVGTLAQIRSASPLGDNLLIEVEGTQRFMLLEYTQADERYLIGTAESIRDAPYDPAVVLPLADEVRRLFHAYFERLVRNAFAAGEAVPHYELPNDAEDLSFVIAAVIQPTALIERQQMLELTDTGARLKSQRRLLEIELARISDPAEDLPTGVVPVMPGALGTYTNRN